MSTKQRILTCRLLEKMKSQELYSKQLGLEDVSTIHGTKLNENARNWQRKERERYV